MLNILKYGSTAQSECTCALQICIAVQYNFLLHGDMIQADQSLSFNIKYINVLTHPLKWDCVVSEEPSHCVFPHKSLVPGVNM